MNRQSQLIHVFRLLVALIHYVVIITELLRALVYQTTLVDHQIVVPNVQLMQNALEILRVSTKNVEIHVLVHVVYMQHVIQLNMFLSVFVKMDTPEIHLVDVQSYSKVR